MNYTLELTKENGCVVVLGKYDLRTAIELKQLLSKQDYHFSSIEIWNDNCTRVS